MGFLNEYSTNVMCACIGAIVAAIIFIIPNNLYIAAVVAGCNDADCYTTTTSGSWFIALTILFIVFVALFVVFLLIMLLSSTCCKNFTCDNYFFSLCLGLVVVSAADYLSFTFAGVGLSNSNDDDYKLTICTFAAYTRWSNIAYIILGVAFFLVAVFVKTWTCCRKTITAVVGCVFAFLLCCIFVGTRMDNKYTNLGDSNFKYGVMVLNGVIAAGVFALLFVFTSISTCLGKNCCKCGCCKC